MNSKMLIGLAVLWLLGSLISLTLEGSYIGQETQFDANGKAIGTTTTLNALMWSADTPPTNLLGSLEALWGYIRLIWNMLWWNYSFLVGPWAVLRLVGIAVGVTTVIGLLLALRGTPST